MEETKRIGVALPARLIAKLKALAKTNGYTLSGLVRRLLDDAMTAGKVGK